MTDFRVIFWGVRGSYPAPGPHTVRFGGNTPCVQLQIGSHLLILDAGTGICSLGQRLQAMSDGKPVEGTLLITHAHWDHIQGFPFFTPAFQAANRFCIYGTGSGDVSFSEILHGQMCGPYFPVGMSEMEAELQLVEIVPGCEWELPAGITVKTFANNHPNGGVSYRIEHEGRSCSYISDLEHHREPDTALATFVHGTDLLIYDANYTLLEYEGIAGSPARIGWGHSTWEEGIKLFHAANARRLAFFHHDPNRSDTELEEMEREVQKTEPDCFAAREGMVIEL